MFADLKEKAAGFDRKRLYTAAATLLIAGAAGHFMQRSAQEPGNNPPMLAGSVPASASVIAPTRMPSPEASEAVAAVETPSSDVDPQPDEANVFADKPEETAEPGDVAVAAALPDMNDGPPDLVSAAVPEPNLEERAEVTRSNVQPSFELSDAPAPMLATEAEMVSPEPEEEAPVVLAALDDAAAIAQQPEPAPTAAPEAVCEIAFNAAPMPAAMVALTFEAPCNSGEDLGIEHAGLRFSEQLGPDGSLMILVPAMAETAVFTARLEDGRQTSAEAKLDDFSDFERIAIVWKGATGLQLHALENGAAYGEPGHVWAEQPGLPEIAIAGAGGYVSVLGSSADGYAADVYTYPAGLMSDEAGPDISIEAQVMENTCGTRITGQILRSSLTGAPEAQRLSMAVPGCEAVGEYLVLKNLPQELKLARN